MPAFAGFMENEHAYMERGKLLYRSGQFGDALGPFTDAINLNPQSAQAYYWRGIAYSSLKEPDKAIEDLTEAITLEPQQADFFLSRGTLYANKNDHTRAIEDFDHALKLNPMLTAARTNRDFSVSEIARQKKAAEDKIAKDKADAEKLAQEKALAEQAALEAAQHPGKKKKTELAQTTTTAEPARETRAERSAREEKVQREKADAERVARDERLAREKVEAEKAAREKELTESLAKERAEREKMAQELAMAQKAKAEAVALADKKDQPQERRVRDKWALIVGISKFKNPELNLHYPAKDAQDFYGFLTKEGNFAKDHVHLLVDADATRERILSELGDKWLPRVANPDDLVVIYISSHGSPSDLDVCDVNYLIAHDTDVDNLYATGLAMQDLTRSIKARVHSDRVVIILDACHSGAVTPEAKGLVRAANVNPEDVVQGTGQLVISSSLPNQVSWESKKDANSVFTKYLIESLRKDGAKTTLGSAFSYMKDQVQSEVLRERGVLQTPVLKSKWEGQDLMLSAPATSPVMGIDSMPQSVTQAKPPATK